MTAPTVSGITFDRVDDDVIDEISSYLDNFPDCDFILWRRGRMTRALIVGPVGVRGIVDDERLAARVQPHGRLLQDIRAERNDWIVPTTTRSRSAAEQAETWCERHIPSLWNEQEVETGERAPAAPVAEMADVRPISHPRRNRSTRALDEARAEIEAAPEEKESTDAMLARIFGQAKLEDERTENGFSVTDGLKRVGE